MSGKYLKAMKLLFSLVEFFSGYMALLKTYLTSLYPLVSLMANTYDYRLRRIGVSPLSERTLTLDQRVILTFLFKIPNLDLVSICRFSFKI